MMNVDHKAWTNVPNAENDTIGTRHAALDPRRLQRTVRGLAPRKVDLHDGRAEIVAALGASAPGWANAVGDVLPADAPGFGEVEQAVLQAIRDRTPWR